MAALVISSTALKVSGPRRRPSSSIPSMDERVESQSRSRSFVGLEGLRPAQAAELVDTLDGREGRITVEEQELRGHAGLHRAPPIRSRKGGG